MFVDKNSKLHIDKKFIKIEDVVNNWKEDSILNFYGYDLHKNRTIRLFVDTFKKHHEVKCGICGCKASHFRVDFVNNYHRLNLYGFHKTKDGNTEYRRFNLDHIKPKSLISVKEAIELGYDNFQPACEECNTKKGNNIGLSNEERELKCKKYKIERAVFDLYIQTNICKKLKMNSEYAVIKDKVSSYIIEHLDDISDCIKNNQVIYEDSFYQGKLKGNEKNYTARDKIFNMYLNRNVCKACKKSGFYQVQKMVKTYIYNHLDEISSYCS